MGSVLGALLAALAGTLNAVQAGTNAVLGRQVGPFGAGLFAFGTQILLFVALGAATGRLAWPSAAQLSATPWWAWTGGLLGGGIVLAQLFLAQPLGSALFVGLTVTAAIVTSLALDHFALVGFQQHPISAGRIAGALLMIGGLGLIARF